MDDEDDAPSGERGSNRAKMAQDRSRQTRRKIVKAALKLWSRRGFDEGYDATTVEEIADHAGISRGSVYYYFAKKDDVLRELAWLTAEDIHEHALRSLMRKDGVDEVLDEMMQVMARKVSKSDPAVVRRMMQIGGIRDPESIRRDEAPGGLSRAFVVIFAHAQELGELPRRFSSLELGEIMASLCTSCITLWSLGVNTDLKSALRSKAVFVLAGARGQEASATVQRDNPRRLSRGNARK
jgi:AcrR family transcriptional regulator